MAQQEELQADRLGRFRAYLRFLAGQHLDPRFKSQLDPSDIVQETLRKAQENLDQCRGKSDAELAAWLRQILVNTLKEEARKRHTGKRDVARERSLEAAVEESSARWENWLATEQSTPSEVAQRQELVLRVAEALEQLSQAQQEVVFLHHLQGRPVAEVAKLLERSEAAVGSLLQRALKKLRPLLEDLKPE
jgi:RNA polymerase sigma-70 factor (ECF subfamily)